MSNDRLTVLLDAAVAITRLEPYYIQQGEFAHRDHCAHADTLGAEPCDCGLTILSAEIVRLAQRIRTAPKEEAINVTA